MLNLQEALEVLKKNEITSSAQVFRRWLRAGNVPGAYQNSMKEGWKIPEDGLQQLIVTRSNRTYEAGYEAGYAAGIAKLEERELALLQRGFHEFSYMIQRREVRERASSLFTKKDILQVIDDVFFKERRSNPRSSIEVVRLGDFYRINNFVYRENDLMLTDHEAIEDKLIDLIIHASKEEMFRRKREQS
ncbi:hypothetical protein [Listeria booriae]|uniref:hypothetical protein n=1 Tax=Listeria booriae TaxID=1552123 RepID=UPI001E3F5D76|nr:hypothetical protein [Listeria booriae]MCD2208560.1 hypothetical protein [Listeria booriae]